MNLQSNDFELFGLAQKFAQDLVALDTRWKALQREAHPDKFSAQGAAAQRVAMQWSVRINEAYQRLKTPLKRAAYLCELQGSPVNAHSNTAMPKAFLMQQMQWREDLEEAASASALEALSADVSAAEKHCCNNVKICSMRSKTTRKRYRWFDALCLLINLAKTSLSALTLLNS